ncbi:hypothetical protein GUITHDRAFT_122704 [Guillardia theta CCMP2712]|uniref:Uncharacterized protein n=1 Tax=Guillardia theta (strain CCMP2712) TaxID=905079 RepID=L1I492_GUITC|nr:hypothetical protein GUITHDRAFT_122704 [Guillardia theta CCMP2712]EKX31088.1 hypothetical protein GUITHDRAFT_122704 [Guillardia theta CCMP2712]|eukprot:XP_005818068.1 hypothetical protein GUITHDRAFT_122704 [Guillardia theta CCMP2712]
MEMLSMLYHYHRKFTGNVCTDWRLTHDLHTLVEGEDGKSKLVKSKAFEQFLNPDYAGTEAGSCQEAGYKSKQLRFSVYVKSPAEAATHVQSIL